MAAIPIQDASAGLANATFAAAANGDTIASGSRGAGWDLGVVLLVKNGDATTTNVTIDGHPLVAVPAAGQGVIPAYRATFGSPLLVTYSKLTSLTVAAARLTPAP
jgi:hypothetical protein